LVGFTGDKGLLATEEAKHYAISSKFHKPIDNTEKDLVVQYEVKFETESGMSCGGAYIKLLEENFSVENFGDDTPYLIMFGPDKWYNNINLVVLQIKYISFLDILIQNQKNGKKNI
jgi:calnexin